MQLYIVNTAYALHIRFVEKNLQKISKQLPKDILAIVLHQQHSSYWMSYQIVAKKRYD